jgi:hypothetical protein
MSRDLVYHAFCLYFGENLTLVKINSLSDQHATYAARIYSLLAEPRYVLAIAYQDFKPKGTPIRLRDLRWESFQTRVIATDFGLEDVGIPKENNGVFDDLITVYKRDKANNKVIYQCHDIPLMVELIAGKKGSIVDFPDKATLEGALETFQCVAYFA